MSESQCRPSREPGGRRPRCLSPIVKGRESSDTGSGSHAAKLSFLWPQDFPELGLKTGNQATWILYRGVRQLRAEASRAISRARSSFAIIQRARTHPKHSQKQEARMLQMLKASRVMQTLPRHSQRAETRKRGNHGNALPCTCWATRSTRRPTKELMELKQHRRRADRSRLAHSPTAKLPADLQ